MDIFNRCNKGNVYLSIFSLSVWCADMVDEQKRWSLPRINVARHLRDVYWAALCENYFLSPCQCGFHNTPCNEKRLSDSSSSTTVSKSVNLHLRTVAAAVQTVSSPFSFFLRLTLCAEFDLITKYMEWR